MREIIELRRQEIPPLPKEIKIKCASCGFMNGNEIEDISETSIQNIVKKVCKGEYSNLFLSPDENGDFQYLKLVFTSDIIFLQIIDEETSIRWSCFDPKYLNSDEIAPFEVNNSINKSAREWSIQTEDMYLGEGWPEMKYTMKDRELAAKCVEWYIHTLEPYPGMDWLKMTW